MMRDVLNGTRVFITGATGFLGSALARALLQGGATVHALARPNFHRDGLRELPITWHEGDITDPRSLPAVLAGADYIIHAAGRLGEAGVPEQVYECVNVDGTRNVLSAALSAGSKARILHLSSPGVLGTTPAGPASEDAAFAPTNPYERSKAAAERLALDFARRGMAVVVARPGFIYGPGDRHVLKLFQAVRRGHFFYIDGGRHLTQPTFIADAVAGMLLCLTQGRIGEVYHITGPQAVTFRELGETIAAAIGVRPPRLNLPRWFAIGSALGLEALGRVVGHKPPLSRTGVDFFSADRVFSHQKAQHQLGYTPQHDLTTGVARTVTWYRQQGWL